MKRRNSVIELSYFIYYGVVFGSFTFGIAIGLFWGARAVLKKLYEKHADKTIRDIYKNKLLYERMM